MVQTILSFALCVLNSQEGDPGPPPLEALTWIREKRSALREDFGAAFSPDGARLALQGSGAGVEIWNLRPARKSAEWTQPYPEASLSSAAFAPDGTWLAAAMNHGSGRSNVVLWAGPPGPGRVLFPFPEDLYQLAVSPDGRFLAVTRRAEVHVLEPAKENQVCRIPSSGMVRFRPDSRSLLVAGPGGKLGVWSIEENPKTLHERPLDPTVIRIYADGMLVALGLSNRDLVLRNAVTGRDRVLLRGAPGVQGASFSEDGRLLVVASRDQSLRSWELPSGAEVTGFRVPESDALSLALAPDAREIALLLRNGGILLVHWSRLVLGGVRPNEDVGPLCDHLNETEGPTAYRAVWALQTMGDKAASELSHRFLAEPAGVRDRISSLLSRLDGSEAESAQASRELADLGAEAAVLQAIAAGPSALRQRRLEQILEDLPRSKRFLEDSRAIQVLELLGSPPARRTLQQLSGGTPGLKRTEWAEASLRRLSLRTP
jgi:hypothetical protein